VRLGLLDALNGWLARRLDAVKRFQRFVSKPTAKRSN